MFEIVVVDDDANERIVTQDFYSSQREEKEETETKDGEKSLFK